MIRTTRRLKRMLAWVSLGYAFAGLSCVPAGGIREVAAQNIVGTFNLITSSIVDLFFFDFQPFFFGAFF
jgi:hypothetical protein